MRDWFALLGQATMILVMCSTAVQAEQAEAFALTWLVQIIRTPVEIKACA